MNHFSQDAYREYYEMDFSGSPALNNKSFVVDNGFAKITVPQNGFILAEGPGGENNDLRFVDTMVAMCTALAFVGWRKNQPYPMVMLAHLDDQNLEDHIECGAPSKAEMLLSWFRQFGLSGLHAHVINGDLEPPLVGSVVKTLRKARINHSLTLGCHYETPTFDLVDGLPVAPSVTDDCAEYKPTGLAQNWFYNIALGPERHIRNSPAEWVADLREPIISDHFYRSGQELTQKSEDLISKESYDFAYDAPALGEPKAAGIKKASCPHKRKAKSKETSIIDSIPVVSIEDYTLG